MVVHGRAGIGARCITLLMSSRAARSAEPLRDPGQHTLFMVSSRTARRAEPVRHPGRRVAPSRYVIPDGAQRRAGTSSRTARRAEPGSRQAPRKSHWIPACAGMTAKRGASLFTMSSRTARRAEPGSRQAPRKRHWIPACAGMTAKGGASLFMVSSRTARSAEPGSRWAPRKSHWIPARAYADAGFPAGMTAERVAATSCSWSSFRDRRGRNPESGGAAAGTWPQADGIVG